MTERVVIIGAGEAGRMVAREISLHPGGCYELVGFLDDDDTLRGRVIEGAPVMGSCDEIPEAVRREGVAEVIIAVPSGSREFIRRIVGLCRDAHVSFRIVPGLIEIIRGPARLEQIREVHPEDLLGRETVEFDEDAIGAQLAGRRVMITGAGGSIGGEICRQVGRFGPGELQLLGRGENQIYEIEHELRTAYPSLNILAIIADIRDRSGIGHVFDRLRPEFVYHAAAHKHVHYMESHPEEAVKNNILGTANIIAAAKATAVQRVVMLSTDKAVAPGGVMGATKRLAEYLMVHGSRDPDGPRLMSVRFGNVLGSRGSVVPLFMRQICAGGPVTVSDPGASRFFMTLKEACMLVVQASVMGKGGEVFILRMGSPIKIVDMARDLIALHGLRPEIDVSIKITGLRPGEKLHEDLTVEGEDGEISSHDYILTSYPRLPEDLDLESTLHRLCDLADQGKGDAIRRLLGDIIPDARLTC